MCSDLWELDLLMIPIDRIHLGEDLMMVGTVGVDLSGQKHSLGVVEGAAENAAVFPALLENLIERGLDPNLCRLIVVDAAKALSKAIRHTFRPTPRSSTARFTRHAISPSAYPNRCMQVSAATLRHAGELDDAPKAECLLRHLAQRLDPQAPGVSGSILEGLDEILTVTRLGLPPELRRSPACTNMIESMNSVVRQVCRNVTPWRNVPMALGLTGAVMLEAKKGFRRLKAHRHLPQLTAALEAHRTKPGHDTVIHSQTRAA